MIALARRWLHIAIRIVSRLARTSLPLLLSLAPHLALRVHVFATTWARTPRADAAAWRHFDVLRAAALAVVRDGCGRRRRGHGRGWGLDEDGDGLRRWDSEGFGRGDCDVGGGLAGDVGLRGARGFVLYDVGARVAALGGVGPAARVVSIDDAVGDYMFFFLLDFDETHLERSVCALELGSWTGLWWLGGSGCDRVVIRGTISVGCDLRWDERRPRTRDRAALFNATMLGYEILQC